MASDSAHCGSTRRTMLERASERCAACNGPIYYPHDDARPHCKRIHMPAVVVRTASDQNERIKMAEKTITYEDYLKLTGLLALADEHNRALAAINRAAAQITGEDADDDGSEYYGHTSDEIYQKVPNARDLLRRLKIEVEAPVEAVEA